MSDWKYSASKSFDRGTQQHVKLFTTLAEAQAWVIQESGYVIEAHENDGKFVTLVHVSPDNL